MYRPVRFKFGLGFCIVIVVWLAITGGVYLGRFYLEIIRQGNVPQGTKVNATTSKPVAVPSDERVLQLNTIPVYYLQVGVYTDLQGAEEAAKPLRDLGYNPYITQTAPFRLWLGVYPKRTDTEFIKQQLRDKGFGSFTASSVINGSNLRYNKGTEPFIQEISPVLEQYTAWMKENLALFDTDSVQRLNWNQVNQQFTVTDKVYDNLVLSSRGLTMNNTEISQGLTLLSDTVGGYQVQLQKFRRDKDQQSFAALQNTLLRFIDNYLLLWEKLDNINKT